MSEPVPPFEKLLGILPPAKQRKEEIRVVAWVNIHQYGVLDTPETLYDTLVLFRAGENTHQALYACPIPRFVFRHQEPAEARKHYRKVHLKHMCPRCYDALSDTIKIETHLKSDCRGTDKAKERDRLVYQCPFCSDHIGDREHRREHVLQKHGPKSDHYNFYYPYQCPPCKQQFSTDTVYRAHRYKCPFLARQYHNFHPEYKLVDVDDEGLDDGSDLERINEIVFGTAELIRREDITPDVRDPIVKYKPDESRSATPPGQRRSAPQHTVATADDTHAGHTVVASSSRRSPSLTQVRESMPPQVRRNQARYQPYSPFRKGGTSTAAEADVLNRWNESPHFIYPTMPMGTYKRGMYGTLPILQDFVDAVSATAHKIDCKFPNCGKSIKGAHGLKDHYRRMHGPLVHCPDCGALVRTGKEVVHAKTCKRVLPIAYCHFCYQAFWHDSDEQKHHRVVHAGEVHWLCLGCHERPASEEGCELHHYYCTYVPDYPPRCRNRTPAAIEGQ